MGQKCVGKNERRKVASSCHIVFILPSPPDNVFDYYVSVALRICHIRFLKACIELRAYFLKSVPKSKLGIVDICNKLPSVGQM